MKKTVCILFFVLSVCSVASFVCAAEGEDPWKQEIAMGYTQKTGNAQSKEFIINYEGIRKTDYSALDIKAGALYSSVNKKMDGQKYNGSVRFAPELDRTDCFGFGKFEVEHDRFAGIDYRYVPSVGAGYWFAREEDWMLSGELGVGHEYVKYTNGSDDDNIVLIPRFFCQKSVFDKARLSEEMIFYPNLEDVKKYRIRSEARFTDPLSDVLSLRVSFIDEFNTDPTGDAKKNDTQLMLSLVYGF